MALPSRPGPSNCPPAGEDTDFYDFSLDEIAEQLRVLGYNNIPRNKLIEFKRDLDCMLQDKISECESVLSEDTVENENNGFSDDFLYLKRCPAYESGRNEGDGGGTGGGVFKRKVVRRDYDGHKYHDESFSEVSDYPGASDGEATPRYRHEAKNYNDNHRIQYSAPVDDYETYPDQMNRSRHARFLDNPVAEVLDYTKEFKPMSARSMSSNYSSSGSVIRPQKTRPVPRKHDPVSRYQQYNDFWKVQKAPGEKAHRQLRWAVKEAMMIHDIPEKKPQSQIPANDYIPPTENHRDHLRWNIRQELALNGIPSADFSTVSSSSSHRNSYYDY